MRNILTYPDGRLHEKSQPVEAVTDEIKSLVAEMFLTMYAKGGVGLAAIQVGEPKRLFIMDCGFEGVPTPKVFINPEIIALYGMEEPITEGCLSVPDFFEEVKRWTMVRYRALDEQGNVHEGELEGLEAQCFQHEYEHLEGVVFVQHLPLHLRDKARKKMKEIARLKRK